MEKILGLDLGTNSIGWAIRDSTAEENQIVDAGVLTFDKGVGEEKGNEVPLVKARTMARSKRRNYQAEKYRKWELVKCLIASGMCPLTEEELYWWKRYEKDELGNHKGRKYPQSEKFMQWIRFDFDGDGKPDFERFGFDKNENIYLFRALAVSENKEHKEIFRANPHILGRVFYHLVQRRGFKGRDEEDIETKTILEGSKETNTPGVNEIFTYLEKYKTLGAALYYFNRDTGKKIRKRYNLRAHYEKELFEICRVHHIDENNQKKLWKAIIWQRPLRSQKGLVGYCSYESPEKNEKGGYIKGGKKRCPLSHPLYEEYRTWNIISNLKIITPDEIDRNVFLKTIVYPLFIRVSDCTLSDLKKEIEKTSGRVTAKYNLETTFPSNEFLYRLKDIFGEQWRDILKWEETVLNIPKSGKYYRVEDLWHDIYYFITIKNEDKEKLLNYIRSKWNFDEKQMEAFKKIRLPQGYASLSISAITKILPYLKEGLLHSEAIFLANIDKVFNRKLSQDEKINLIEAFKSLRQSFIEDKLKLGIVNELIADQLNSKFRFGMDAGYMLDSDDYNDIEIKILETIGESPWLLYNQNERQKVVDFIAEKYIEFLRKPLNSDPATVFHKIYRFDDLLKKYLNERFDIPIDRINKYLWHPSEIDKYSPASFSKNKPENKVLGDPNPISKGFKNPMAMKTLHKLKGLVNYLLETEKIDKDTRVVVELARELNDANMRRAIHLWQKRREEENRELAQGIINTAKEKYPDLDENDPQIADKARLWYEQLDKGEEVMKQAKALKSDILKMKLWKEQECRCLYTGRVINIADLFNGIEIDVEHTVPLSISWSSEQWNLTVCDAFYNREIKKKNIPVDLVNYETSTSYDKDGGYILKRIEPWIAKLDSLKKQLHFNIKKTKGNQFMEKSVKDEIIVRRRLLQMDIAYWEKKIETFNQKKVNASWRRQQIIDTQIASKYAFHYLKTVFDKVEVQKGSTTSIFRKIFNIQPKKQIKDRTKHSHHALDAAVLTLIPSPGIRKRLMAEYTEAIDKEKNFHTTPSYWKDFNAHHILDLENKILINYQKKDTLLLQTKKKVRIGGKVQFLYERLGNDEKKIKRDIYGRPQPKIAKGDTIRGQLHNETIYGAIKLKNNDGETVPVKYVKRIHLEVDTLFGFKKKGNPDDFIKQFEEIVDPIIRNLVILHIRNRLEEGVSQKEIFNEPVWMLNKQGQKQHIIKRVRVYVKDIPIEIKKHDDSFLSTKDYKQFKYADNATNAVLCCYKPITNKLSINNFYRIYTLFDLANIKKIPILEIQDGVEYKLAWSVKPGQHLLLQQSNDENISELHRESVINVRNRLYRIETVYRQFSQGYLYHYSDLKFHLDARKNDKSEKMPGRSNKPDYENPFAAPLLRINIAKSSFLIQDVDFKITPDGKLLWIDV